VRLALANAEPSMVRQRQPQGLKTLHRAARRLFLSEAPEKRLRIPPPSFHLQNHTLGGIVHPASESKLRRESINERTKTNPLHRAADSNFQPFFFRCQQTIFGAWFHEL